MSKMFYDDAFPITPSDTADLPRMAQGLTVGGAGTLKVTTAAGNTVTLNSVAAGTVLPLRVSKVFSSGTSATNINGMANAVPS